MAQNPFTQNSHDIKIKKEAEKLSRKYDKRLGMIEDQLLKFEIKVEEFMINEKKIRESDLSTKEKINALRGNYAKETADMNDILTRPQYKLYRKLKPKFQPIDPVVVGQVETQ
ncbi:hypothetical protein GCM10022258_12990 [Aquimarina gracilis]